jgi:hypothetical protein
MCAAALAACWRGCCAKMLLLSVAVAGSGMSAMLSTLSELC